MFWWRVLRGILSVESTLRNGHIETMARCKVCLGVDEDMVHAMIMCSHAQSLWSEAKDCLGVKLLDLYPNTWCKDILCNTRIAEVDRAKIVTIMWAIWTSRNNITHDRVGLHPLPSLKLMRERERL